MRKTSLTLTVAGFALLCMTTAAKAQNPGVEINYDVLKNTAIHQHYTVQKEKEQAAQENSLTAPEVMTTPDVMADPLVDATPVDAVAVGEGAFLTGPEVSGEVLDGAVPILTDPMPHQEDAAADAEKLFEAAESGMTAPEAEAIAELPVPAEAAPETIINWVEGEEPATTVKAVEAPVVDMMPADPRVLKTQPDELPESLRREMLGTPSGDLEEHGNAAPIAAPVEAEMKAEVAPEMMPETTVPRPLQRPATAKQQAIEKREAAVADVPEAVAIPAEPLVEDVAAEKLPLPEADLMPETAAATAVSMDVENAVSLAFEGSESRITPEMEAVLKDITTRLAADNALRVQLNAFASGEAGNQSSARRVSLSRALSARDYLVEQGGITPTRMDVRALGDQTQKQPIDRIDFVFVE